MSDTREELMNRVWDAYWEGEGHTKEALERVVNVVLASAWQPIETAPKDGTRVLLFGAPNEVPSLRPLIQSGYWKATTGFMAPGCWLVDHAVGPSFKITHWMPLPAAPALSKATEPSNV